jgi:DNA-binding transcriptional LysR family regulator
MQRLPLSDLEVFLAIAEAGSLRAAAAALGVQPPAVSSRLKMFENRIGVSLFARTTRSVRLTDAGRALLRRARPALGDLSDALEEARGIGNARKGAIRLTLPYRAYQLAIAPKLAAFQRAYPEIELELSFNEGLVDIVGQGFHAGVRLGDYLEADMVAARLTPGLKGAYVASPAYLAEHGRPKQPRDLLSHNCIRHRRISSRTLADWEFKGPEGLYSVAVKGNLIFDSLSAIVEAALAGLGIGWSLRPGVAAELAAGRLVSLLGRYVPERPGFFLYYPRENARLEILRLFVAFMRHRAR